MPAGSRGEGWLGYMVQRYKFLRIGTVLPWLDLFCEGGATIQARKRRRPIYVVKLAYRNVLGITQIRQPAR